MNPVSPAPARKSRLSVTLLVALVVLPVRGGAQPADPPFFRVDACERPIRQLLTSGYRRSTTFRRLTAEIERSKWRVFIQSGLCPARDTVGCMLHFIGTYEGDPYLRILVKLQGRHPDRVIATLAHELQHVVEVIEAPQVADVDTLRALFRHIGRERMRSDSAIVYETDAAEDAGDAVLRDLRQRN